MKELALFAGAGGGILGGKLLGWKTKCAVEIDPYCRKILKQRQRDGILNKFPIHGDIKTFDGKPWRNKIDIVTGGFPCQDISCAGKKRGLTGKNSRLVFEMLRIVEEIRPRFVFAENSPQLRTRGLGVILEKFTDMGYDARWCVLGGWHFGAPHRRNRMWILAYPNSHNLRKQPRGSERENRESQTKSESNGKNWNVAYPNGTRKLQPQRLEQKQRGWTGNKSKSHDDSYPNGAQCEGMQCSSRADTKHPDFSRLCWWNTEPELGRVADGVANRVDRLKAIGNGQIPIVAAVAWDTLAQGLL